MSIFVNSGLTLAGVKLKRRCPSEVCVTVAFVVVPCAATKAAASLNVFAPKVPDEILGASGAGHAESHLLAGGRHNRKLLAARFEARRREILDWRIDAERVDDRRIASRIDLDERALRDELREHRERVAAPNRSTVRCSAAANDIYTSAERQPAVSCPIASRRTARNSLAERRSRSTSSKRSSKSSPTSRSPSRAQPLPNACRI
ncbi:MAG TPA: hypothetical protein VNI54_03960 [Thermoanaerobaculia bacterium]|nr:hypothetical protein [Thermoanaerobaculia bacterium]